MKRVLIAEDDPAIRALVAEAVANEGYAVETAIDGHDALRRCSEFKPDVVVLDLQMPVLDGYEFLSRRGPECTAPVVVISATPRPEKLTPELGVVAVVAKPFAVASFLAILTGAIVSTGIDAP